jgi:peptide/nickel transport system substrate-binding protein
MKKSWVLKLALFLALSAAAALAQFGGELRLCIHSEPKTFDPLMVQDDASDRVRYLTTGVLIRLNRQTQKLEPELAKSWKVTDAGKRITFELRPNVYFSDGTPFTSEDVAYTIRTMMDPKLHTPVGDVFAVNDAMKVDAVTSGPTKVSIVFSEPIAGLEGLFDQVPIMSAKSPKKEAAVLGPFYIADHKAGSYLLLKRNPNYWKRDAGGRQLPYLDSVRIDIQQNQEMEMLRLAKGDVHLINNLDAELFDRLAAQDHGAARDLGPGFDTEFLWFNQVPTAPFADYKKEWFKSTNFRRAISESINRQDIARIAYNNHAEPAIGPTSPANKFWVNTSLKPHPYNTGDALRLLAQDGFRFENGKLRDKAGHEVEFSIITNAGNKSREKMAALIQQDLAKIGVKVNISTFDYASVVERITRTSNYEAAVLGFLNDDLDPTTQMAVWPSSAAQHAWNPNQKNPATAWEAEIDKLMAEQAASMSQQKRKAAWDRVQQIAWEQEPIIYLVTKHGLAGVSSAVRNAAPAIMRPQTYWNIEYLSLGSGGAAGK